MRSGGGVVSAGPGSARYAHLWTEGAIVASSRPFPHGAHRDRWAASSNGIWSASDIEIVATVSAVAVAHNFAS